VDQDHIAVNVSSAAQADTQQQLTERHRLIQAIGFLNRTDLQILGENNRVQFLLDSASRRPVVKVVRADTKDVIYQLPSDYVLELARKVRQKERANRP